MYSCIGCGGQLTLVYQYDVFFSCLYASCVVRGEEKGKGKECDVRVGRRSTETVLCFVDL